jgi:hypothetical protein
MRSGLIRKSANTLFATHPSTLRTTGSLSDEGRPLVEAQSYFAAQHELEAANAGRNPRLYMQFSGQYTGKTGGSTGNGLADMLVGIPVYAAIDSYLYLGNRQPVPSLSVQDDFKVTLLRTTTVKNPPKRFRSASNKTNGSRREITKAMYRPLRA